MEWATQDLVDTSLDWTGLYKIEVRPDWIALDRTRLDREETGLDLPKSRLDWIGLHKNGLRPDSTRPEASLNIGHRSMWHLKQTQMMFEKLKCNQGAPES